MTRANRRNSSRRSRGPLQRQLPFGEGAARSGTPADVSAELEAPSDGATLSGRGDLPGRADPAQPAARATAGEPGFAANRLQGFAAELASLADSDASGRDLVEPDGLLPRELRPARTPGSTQPRTPRGPGRRGPFRRIPLEVQPAVPRDPSAPPAHRAGPTIGAPSAKLAAGPRGPLHLEPMPAPASPVLQLVGVAFTLATFLAAALWL